MDQPNAVVNKNNVKSSVYNSPCVYKVQARNHEFPRITYNPLSIDLLYMIEHT